ncbi:bifunctional diaminohydroxyphosphoribosylaminopyrimidine deaminase/5-amino-6-(5-phosphoribosylamino)uracil reductase RibD [Antarcticibacterium flavum]|uniref:Riboflavin biosynthesis protein RibD n=1 Tax=Antarcticibacterium flavum TaxID=2058175 RepID=A0A5B7X701_9FLAO|nr:bifunctional diaminohydroxyphosphoribosylaminopyrimidine deaminase/5-amino-6-(5-phosphoribosylamino)uracil reductase RibD [Antarcticibacterium flavum]MCM4161075.1 bifunctional diaminohydroxyphosphoribosylaminopyrimidine deaminase/5-amino-6-(5-phosphoribosylamino)uracil reductase RibD [Antarcticibacterium sp. W02-3]QCY70498.1 bifunctional diaminohydroxyphosphoribosylaminopyrimidine deaminase/5-amino-6-(5-phosphoribosylamino)uracil reductase RibD [Antarcticibacterium flavum]
MNIHEKYIKRCIQLAFNGLGKTYPNPMVGSVIVQNNRIIGEGWHRKAGEAHAEVNAINAVEDKSLLKTSTIYVSLEPCSHFGKTPPCSDLIIASGIKKVVIGTVDPFEEVAGRGIKKLLEAGCKVKVGVLEKECRELNKRFFTYHQLKRPYIILKWAQSTDGFLAPAPTPGLKREPVWITNKYTNQLVHKWRSEEQAILVGTNTAVADDPKLNARLWKGNDPVRLLIDRNLRTPSSSALFNGSIRTIVFCDKPSADKNELTADRLSFEVLNFDREIIQQICDVVYKHKLQALIVEGGTRTLQSFIDAGLWDEARILTGRKTFGKGLPAPKIQGKPYLEKFIDGDELKILKAYT